MNDTAIGLTTNPSDYAKAVADMIEQGRVDPFLRVLFDVIVDRKKALEATPAGLPQQDDVGSLPSDEVVVHVFEAGRVPPVTDEKTTGWFDPPSQPVVPPAAAPASVIPTDPKGYRRKARGTYTAPDKTEVVFAGTIKPLTPDQQISLDHDPIYQIALGGHVYDKRDIKGKYVDYTVDGGAVARFKIVGIGPKAVQGLLVFSPDELGDANMTYRGKPLQVAWDGTRPVYLPHTAIAHWLG